MTPRDPWGGLRGLGGAPPRGYPTWVPPSNNLNILCFWNILETLLRPNKQKNGTGRAFGGAPSHSGGCFGGVRRPGGPPRLNWSLFFCSFCLNNYSKIFQKRRIFKLLLGGTHVGYPPGGAPPRPLRPPQGSLGVTEFWKKMHKFPKIM